MKREGPEFWERAEAVSLDGRAHEIFEVGKLVDMGL